MYLTRFQLNPGRINTGNLLRNPRAARAAVLSTMPGESTTDDGRTLWRIDSIDHRHFLYIVSPTAPDLTGLIETSGWPTRPDAIAQTREYTPLLNKLTNGQRWQFRLTASPVDRHGQQIIRHRTHTDRLAWLDKHATKAGFTIPRYLDEPDVKITGMRPHRFGHDAGGKVTIHTTTFTGHLDITNADTLRAALTHGIGRSRAYGCGLLTLAPPK